MTLAETHALMGPDRRKLDSFGGYDYGALTIPIGARTNPLADFNFNSAGTGWRDTEHSDFKYLDYIVIYEWYKRFLASPMQGLPLDDVGVAITTGRKINMGVGSESNTKFDKINKVFDYRFRNFSTINLWFFKSGYEEQRLQWGEGGKHTGVRVVMKKGTGSSSRPGQENRTR